MTLKEIGNIKENRNLVIMIAAFAAVYLIWGSTYLAIKYAIETIPTFLMAGVRFTVAGAVLYAISMFTKDYARPKLVEWRTSLIMGTLLLAIGNGGVVLAEHYISSSLAALLVATVPFFIVLLSWGFMGTGRPSGKVTLGLLVGFLGVYMLISGPAAGGGSNQTLGTVLIIVSTLGWAIGSLYGTRAPAAKSVFQASGMQMLAGGSVLLLIGTFAGEWSQVNVSAMSFNSIFALIYLIVFGAIVAYTAFSWLLKNASPTAVTTYAYVNPAVAVFLGWAIAGESLTSQMLVGAAIIVGSVALITSQKKAAKKVEREMDVSVAPSALVSSER